MEKTKFWEEAPGQQSATRLMFIVLIGLAVFVALYQLFKTGTFEAPNFTVIVAQACALKIWQKTIEVKPPNQEVKQPEA